MAMLTPKSGIGNKFKFRISLIPYFSLNREFLFFGPNLSKNGISNLKHKMNRTIEFCIFELV